MTAKACKCAGEADDCDRTGVGRYGSLKSCASLLEAIDFQPQLTGKQVEGARPHGPARTVAQPLGEVTRVSQKQLHFRPLVLCGGNRGPNGRVRILDLEIKAASSEVVERRERAADRPLTLDRATKRRNGPGFVVGKQ